MSGRARTAPTQSLRKETARNMSKSGRMARHGTSRDASSSPPWAQGNCAPRSRRQAHHPRGQYEGYHPNAPNDLAIKSDGTVYFTDIRKGSVTTDQSPPDGVAHTGSTRTGSSNCSTALSRHQMASLFCQTRGSLCQRHPCEKGCAQRRGRRRRARQWQSLH